MLFPSSPRVIYERNPLAEVICQLRFPRILRIDTELPARFQDAIRSAFPNFDQAPAGELGKLPPDLARLVGLERVLGNGQQNYEFSSANGTWKVALTSDFLALVATRYSRWEAFKEQLSLPLRALEDVYGPSFFSRIGLRYRDVVRRSDLGLGQTPWHQLLEARILGEVAAPEMEAAAVEVHRSLLLQLDEPGDKVRVQHGFARVGQDPETCYLIDCDFFVEQQTELDDATTVLDRLNKESGRLFRWCIQPSLHEAMGPKPAT